MNAITLRHTSNRFEQLRPDGVVQVLICYRSDMELACVSIDWPNGKSYITDTYEPVAVKALFNSVCEMFIGEPCTS